MEDDKTVSVETDQVNYDVADVNDAEIDALIDNANLLDDILMTAVFDGNIPATQRMINIILEREDIVVNNVTVQKYLRNPLTGGYDVRLDVYAEDSEGNHYDFEIQLADEGADRTRARFNSSALDQRMLRHRQKYKEIKDSYVIFITQNDVLGKGRALSHIDRIIIEDNEPWGDGNHIIYANAAYPDTTTDVGKLMHDFRQRDPKNMFIKELRDGVSHAKNTKEGRERMGKEIEDYADKKATTKAILEVVKAYRVAHFTDEQIKTYLMENFNLKEDEADSFITPVPAA